MTKKNDYWEERTKKRRAALDRNVEKANKELIENFEEALKNVQAEINNFWIRYAENNEITLSQAQQLLSLKEWRAFKGTLEEFQQLAKDSIGTFNLELENLSMRARISRYQELELNVKSILDQLYQKQNEVIGRTATDAYMDQYFHTLFNVEQYKGVHTDFMIPSAKAIEDLVKYPFNGADYSERLWRHQEDLTFKLKEALTNMFVEGKNPYDYKDKFASLFQVKRSEAYRLLDTEHAYDAEAASQAAYEADGIMEYKINATLDSKTSQICREMDSKVFKVSERKEGKNCPPFHPYCRTTTEPHIAELDDIHSTRVARDADGKKVYVPMDMTYEEWHEKYVGNNERFSYKEKAEKNRDADRRLYEKYRNLIGADNLPDSFDDFQNMKYNEPKRWELLKDYKKSRTTNAISAFTPFKLYEEYKERIEREIVGLTTYDNVKITSQSKHFIERIFGTTVDSHTNKPRCGVEIESVIDALKNPIDIINKNGENGVSRLYRGKDAEVSINPSTGNLIQTNPTHKNKKK